MVRDRARAPGRGRETRCGRRSGFGLVHSGWGVVEVCVRDLETPAREVK